MRAEPRPSPESGLFSVSVTSPVINHSPWASVVHESLMDLFTDNYFFLPDDLVIVSFFYIYPTLGPSESTKGHIGG